MEFEAKIIEINVSHKRCDYGDDSSADIFPAIAGNFHEADFSTIGYCLIRAVRSHTIDYGLRFGRSNEGGRGYNQEY